MEGTPTPGKENVDMKTDAPEKKPTPANVEANLAAHREGPPPALVRLALRLAAADLAALPANEGGMALHDAAGLLGVDKESPLDAVRAWGLENTRRSRDAVADALRRALADQLGRGTWAKLPSDVLADLRRWAAEDANPEALAEWLDRGGWGKVDGDAVEAALVTAARATVEADGLKDGLACVLWNSAAPYFVLLYDTARADRDKPDVRERIARLTTPRIEPWAALLVPEDLTPPDKAEVLLGLDALKAGLQGFDWSGLGLSLTDKAGRAGDWLGRLAVPWMDERRAALVERADRQSAAVGIALRPKAETDAGKWTPLPRALTVAAAMGGPFSVDVNGETYAPEPGLAGPAALALRPRGMDIVPADWLGNPAQLSLALDLDTPPEAVLEYLGAVVENAARTAHLARLGNICPKLLGLMFAAAPMTGRMVQGTLGELARMLYPDWSINRRGKRDLQGLGAAMMAVKGLRLVETEPDGTRRPYELFIVDMALTAKPDAVLGWTINPWLLRRMQGGKGGGFFLLNMTRWLALGIQNPRLFPLALRLAALWDAARVHNGPFDPARLRPIEADRLCWECNTLPEGAAMFRTGKTDAEAAKVQLKRARANLEADLDALRDAGLLGPYEKRKVHGEGFTVLPVPPADYGEACKRAAQAVRKAKPGRPRMGKG
jgi:hypothetical protein